jgi:hypothetical protein
VLGKHVGPDDEGAGEQLRPDRLPVGVDLEPAAHPLGDAEGRLVLGDPAEVGEGEGGAADHHHQHDRDQHAGQDEHPAVGKLAVQPEGDHADDRGAGEPDRDALEHGRAAVLELEVLEEENGLEALAVDGGEAERDEADEGGGARTREQLPASAVMTADPVGPVDAVDEPVEHHEEHDDRDEAGDRLELRTEGRGCIEDRLHHEPGDDRRREGESRARRHGAPLRPVRPEEAGGDRGEDQDRLESLPEDDHAGVEDRRPVAHRLLGRIGRAGLRRRHQVDEAGDHGEAAEPPGEAGVVAIAVIVGPHERGTVAERELGCPKAVSSLS